MTLSVQLKEKLTLFKYRDLFQNFPINLSLKQKEQIITKPLRL